MSNERFIHEGRHLREWLLQLVEEKPDRRLEASTAINDHLSRVDLYGQPEWSLEQVNEEFQKAIRETVREPGFPMAGFVEKLVSLKLQLAKQYTNLLKRYKQPTVNEAVLTGIALGSIIDALGEELMPAADKLRAMLNDADERRSASAAICRMGEKAIEFYPDLIEGLKLPDMNGEYPMPLGVLLRYYPERISMIVEMTGDTDNTLRRNAIATLMHCGRETIRRFPEIEVMARERMKASTDEDWLAWARMLGDTAVTAKTVKLFLEETRSSEYWHVGVAIDCLREMGLESERVVARLIELLDEFNEYDTDWAWEGGEHTRIIAALQKHGIASKAAIPRLAQLIWSKPSENLRGELQPRYPNEGVIKFLGTFGIEAKAALPGLLDMKEEMEARPITTWDDIGNQVSVPVEERCPDYVLEAIRRMEGAVTDEKPTR